jgi:hypothetical protein
MQSIPKIFNLECTRKRASFKRWPGTQTAEGLGVGRNCALRSNRFLIAQLAHSRAQSIAETREEGFSLANLVGRSTRLAV